MQPIEPSPWALEWPSITAFSLADNGEFAPLKMKSGRLMIYDGLVWQTLLLIPLGLSRCKLDEIFFSTMIVRKGPHSPNNKKKCFS